MALRSKKLAKRGKKGYKARRGRGRGRRMARGVPEKASCTEVVQTQNLVANTNYSSYNISLASTTRALDIAKGYQYYRIKRVTYVIKPTQDTFVSGGNSVPYLYYMVDRTKLFVNGFTINQLKSMGAKPRRVDEKIIKFSYTPSVLTDTYDNNVGANQFVQYKMSPWLPTKDITQVGVWNPNTTDHLGIVWRMEQSFGDASAYSIERQIEFEFKKPATPTTVSAPEDVPTDLDPVV